jgi:anaerobic selenocysteine-containing dehydrogenase
MRNDGAIAKLKRSIARRFLGPERILDLGLRFGPYGGRWNLFSGLTLRKVKTAVHGIDLGPMRPCLPGRLRTQDRKVSIAPGVLLKDLTRIKSRFSELIAGVESNGHLLLIGRRQLRGNNSWMHNSQRLVKGNPAKPLCTLVMNPSDAASRQLKHGQNVQVQSRVGAICLPLEVSDEVMPGVVSIPHGWGHDRKGNRLSVAQQNSGASINDLTDELMIDEVCGTAAFNGTKVEVIAG